MIKSPKIKKKQKPMLEFVTRMDQQDVINTLVNSGWKLVDDSKKAREK